MKVLIIDNTELADIAFNQPLFDFAAAFAVCDIVNYKFIPSLKVMESLYDAVVISGVPLHYSFESVEHRLDYYTWLRYCSLPILGICLGHQIIGKLFGGEIIRDVEAENGVIKTNIIQDDPIFYGLTANYNSFLMHRASVKPLKDFDVLARTASCANIVMKHKIKNIYGMQSHPELTEFPAAAAIFSNFLAIASAIIQTQQHILLPSMEMLAGDLSS